MKSEWVWFGSAMLDSFSMYITAGHVFDRDGMFWDFCMGWIGLLWFWSFVMLVNLRNLRRPYALQA